MKDKLVAYLLDHKRNHYCLLWWKIGFAVLVATLGFLTGLSVSSENYWLKLYFVLLIIFFGDFFFPKKSRSLKDLFRKNDGK